MVQTLTLKDGSLQLPKELLEEFGFPTAGTVTVRREPEQLVIRPVASARDPAVYGLDEDSWPVFVKEPESPRYVTDWLEAGSLPSLESAEGAFGLLTREAFMEGLRRLEDFYGLTSADFFAKWRRGELPQTIDLIMWASDYEALYNFY